MMKSITDQVQSKWFIGTMSTVMEIISITSVLTSFQLKLQLHLQGDCSALSQIVGTQGPFI